MKGTDFVKYNLAFIFVGHIAISGIFSVFLRHHLGGLQLTNLCFFSSLIECRLFKLYYMNLLCALIFLHQLVANAFCSLVLFK